MATRIELFGGLRVVQGNLVHTRFRTHKAANLLAYLSLHLYEAQPRDRLIDLFWPDKELSVGRDGLSTALAQLRRQLEPAGTRRIIVADWQQVRLDPDLVTTDVADFERLLRQARQAGDRQEQVNLLRQAAELYRGALLPECYENWVSGAQNHYQSLMLDTLKQLTRLLEEAEQYADAVAFAQKTAEIDPYAEEICRAQIHLLVRQRQPSAALHVYEQLDQRFKCDLGAPPSAATRQMAETLRQDPRAITLFQAEAAGRTLPAVEPSQTPPAVPAAPSTPGFSLPSQLTRFFGREQEKLELADLLQAPYVRLVTLLGPGGAGKTRLSIEVAAQVAPAFNHRVWFVSLADIPDGSLIVSALFHSLRLPAGGPTDPLDQIVTCLAQGPCLLVLDNIEHLLRDAERPGKGDHLALSGAAALIRLLLERAPGLTCLLTSRQALRLGGEYQFPLPPMTLPAEVSSPDPAALLTNESVALYVDRARAARVDFALMPRNAGSVAALCRRLEGMPLSIEMAAGWAKTLSPEKMLERLERQLDLLVSRRRDLPRRHQGLRATIEWSYDLLTPELRQALARLSLFRGGWTLEAAEAVCGNGAIASLLALQEHSLITVAEPDDHGMTEPRYRMLEPIREFALERLDASGERAEVARHHAAWCLELALASQAAWDGPDQSRLFVCLQSDLDNLRAALDWFSGNPESGLSGLIMAFALQRFWRVCGYLAEARRYLTQALAHPGARELTLERARTLSGLGLVEWTQGEYATATALFNEVLEAFRALSYPWGVAAALGNLGNIAQELGELDRARALQQESLALYREIGNLPGVARCLICLGNIANIAGDYASAVQIYEEILAINRRQQNPAGLRSALNGLLYVTSNLGDREAARRCLRENLQLAAQSDDIQANAYLLGGAAQLAATQGQLSLAATLYGAMFSMRSRHHLPLPPSNQKGTDERLSMLRNAIGDAEFEARMAEGGALTWEEALEAMQQCVQ